MYPSELPLAEIRNVVQIVREQKIAEKKADFAYNLWIIQGYAMSRMVGDPTISLISQAAEEDGLVVLEKLAADDVSAQGAINWVAVVKWALKMLLTLA